MEQRISLITLGARDVAVLSKFYRALGWKRVESPEDIVVFDLVGQALGLYALEKLAEDMGVPPHFLGHGAMTLAYNVRERGEVQRLLTRAEVAGGRILRRAADTDWGGRVGYFSDPEGHIWEIAWNPHSPLGPNGEFRWGGH